MEHPTKSIQTFFIITPGLSLWGVEAFEDFRSGGNRVNKYIIKRSCNNNLNQNTHSGVFREAPYLYKKGLTSEFF